MSDYRDEQIERLKDELSEARGRAKQDYIQHSKNMAHTCFILIGASIVVGAVSQSAGALLEGIALISSAALFILGILAGFASSKANSSADEL